MSSWFFSIDQENPEHWEIAVEKGFWDLRSGFGVQPGDYLYFWQTAERSYIAGTARSLSNAVELGSGDLPWNKSDAKRDSYRKRVFIEPIRNGSEAELTWREIKERTGVSSPHLKPAVQRDEA